MISVLIAQQQTFVRAGLAALLNRQSGVEVIAEAANGDDALEQISAHRPGVALLDVALPGLPGIEVVLRVRDRGLSTPCLSGSGGFSTLGGPITPRMANIVAADANRDARRSLA